LKLLPVQYDGCLSGSSSHNVRLFIDSREARPVFSGSNGLLVQAA
jgi:hypothetical protein